MANLNTDFLDPKSQELFGAASAESDRRFEGLSENIFSALTRAGWSPSAIKNLTGELSADLQGELINPLLSLGKGSIERDFRTSERLGSETSAMARLKEGIIGQKSATKESQERGFAFDKELGELTFARTSELAGELAKQKNKEILLGIISKTLGTAGGIGLSNAIF